MAAKSRIEWTEQTWNPVSGCTKISAGCDHCYAESMAQRLQAMGAKGYEHGFNLQLQPERLSAPLLRRKPTLYFVNSMSDLFHEKIPDEYIDRVMDVIQRSPWHQYQILTKRAARMARYFARTAVPKNAWIGVTVENKAHGVRRIEHLRSIDGRVRFLSVEPLLEDLGALDLTGIDWVIVGGESGPVARRMHPDWARSVRDQCVANGVSFFFKQWGAYGPDGKRQSKALNGRELDGRMWTEMPQLEVGA
jgi:protein gp37